MNIKNRFNNKEFISPFKKGISMGIGFLVVLSAAGMVYAATTLSRGTVELNDGMSQAEMQTVLDSLADNANTLAKVKKYLYNNQYDYRIDSVNVGCSYDAANYSNVNDVPAVITCKFPGGQYKNCNMGRDAGDGNWEVALPRERRTESSNNGRSSISVLYYGGIRVGPAPTLRFPAWEVRAQCIAAKSEEYILD